MLVTFHPSGASHTDQTTPASALCPPNNPSRHSSLPILIFLERSNTLCQCPLLPLSHRYLHLHLLAHSEKQTEKWENSILPRCNKPKALTCCHHPQDYLVHYLPGPEASPLFGNMPLQGCVHPFSVHYLGQHFLLSCCQIIPPLTWQAPQHPGMVIPLHFHHSYKPTPPGQILWFLCPELVTLAKPLLTIVSQKYFLLGMVSHHRPNPWSPWPPLALPGRTALLGHMRQLGHFWSNHQPCTQAIYFFCLFLIMDMPLCDLKYLSPLILIL